MITHPFPEDTTSRTHAALDLHTDGTVTITDADSANGVFAHELSYATEIPQRLEPGKPMGIVVHEFPVKIQIGSDITRFFSLIPNKDGSLTLAWKDDQNNAKTQVLENNGRIKLPAAADCDVRIGYKNGICSIFESTQATSPGVFVSEYQPRPQAPSELSTKALPAVAPKVDSLTPAEPRENLSTPDILSRVRVSTEVRRRRNPDGTDARSQDDAVIVTAPDRQSVFAVVCDGISTSPHPEMLPYMIRKRIESFPPKSNEDFETYIQKTIQLAVAEVPVDRYHSATTFTALRLHNNGKTEIAQLGDSEILRVPTKRETNGKAVPITRTDVAVPITQNGEFSPNTPYHISNRGENGPIRGKMDISTQTAHPGDVYIVTSDGMRKYLTDREIHQYTLDAINLQQDIAGYLVKKAREAAERSSRFDSNKYIDDISTSVIDVQQ